MKKEAKQREEAAKTAKEKAELKKKIAKAVEDSNGDQVKLEEKMVEAVGDSKDDKTDPNKKN